MRVIQVRFPKELNRYTNKPRNSNLIAEELKPFFMHDLDVLIYWHARRGITGFGNAIVRKTGRPVWHYHSLESCYCGQCPSPTHQVNLNKFGTLVTLPSVLIGVAADWELSPLIMAAYKVEEEAVNEAEIDRSEYIFHR